MTIDLPTLMRVVDDKRHDRRLTWKQVAEEIGISPNSLSQLKLGNNSIGTNTFVSLLHWLDLLPQELWELMTTIIIRET